MRPGLTAAAMSCAAYGARRVCGCFHARAPKRRCLPLSTPRVEPAACPGDVWALDFQFDTDYHGKTFKICNVIDEFTREHVGFEVGRSITAVSVIELLSNLAACRGGRP